jgi:hypothetical protein
LVVGVLCVFRFDVFVISCTRVPTRLSVFVTAIAVTVVVVVAVVVAVDVAVVVAVVVVIAVSSVRSFGIGSTWRGVCRPTIVLTFLTFFLFLRTVLVFTIK